MQKHGSIQIIIFLPLALFIFWQTSEAQWTLEKTDGNFSVYLHEDWKDNHAYKAEGTFNIPLERLYGFLLNFTDYPHWINYCSRVVLLHAEQNSRYIYYSYYDLPWPLADRESISEIRITHASDSVIRVISIPSETNFVGEASALRVKQYHESYVLSSISENKVLFRMQGSYYPGGYIPNWVIKKFLTQGPFDILLNIKGALEGCE